MMELTYKVPRTYPVTSIVRVVDGDTYIALVDLGFDLALTARIRSARINAPELPTPAGLAAKGWLEQTITGVDPHGFDVQVRGRDNYGRWLAELVIRSSGINVNDLMVKQGQAEYV